MTTTQSPLIRFLKPSSETYRVKTKQPLPHRRLPVRPIRQLYTSFPTPWLKDTTCLQPQYSSENSRGHTWATTAHEPAHLFSRLFFLQTHRAATGATYTDFLEVSLYFTITHYTPLTNRPLCLSQLYYSTGEQNLCHRPNCLLLRETRHRQLLHPHRTHSQSMLPLLPFPEKISDCFEFHISATQEIRPLRMHYQLHGQQSLPTWYN
jgi:hypothetical protein